MEDAGASGDGRSAGPAAILTFHATATTWIMAALGAGRLRPVPYAWGRWLFHPGDGCSILDGVLPFLLSYWIITISSFQLLPMRLCVLFYCFLQLVLHGEEDGLLS